ncbi:hypothetical protein AB0A69_03445 [Streptomyces sp. NPDC045431]|uniref:hypothetical protein n=1 Tax=Streptomyces sp. NPDC045431 TaxID=3155613 RepID=UPI0033F4A2C0
MKFTQIIDFETERIDDLEALLEERRAALADKSYGPVSRLLLRDRDNPNRYLAVVGFSSYDEALRSNDDPDTTQLAQRLAELCTRPPRFTDCDLLDEQDLR